MSVRVCRQYTCYSNACMYLYNADSLKKKRELAGKDYIRWTVSGSGLVI
jgi:hypothetical protein